MYANGEGAPTNDINAYAWWSLAATQGHESASENKGIITKRMTRQQIAEAQAYATRCFENDYKGCDWGKLGSIVSYPHTASQQR